MKVSQNLGLKEQALNYHLRTCNPLQHHFIYLLQCGKLILNCMKSKLHPNCSPACLGHPNHPQHKQYVYRANRWRLEWVGRPAVDLIHLQLSSTSSHSSWVPEPAMGKWQWTRRNSTGGGWSRTWWEYQPWFCCCGWFIIIAVHGTSPQLLANLLELQQRTYWKVKFPRNEIHSQNIGREWIPTVQSFPTIWIPLTGAWHVRVWQHPPPLFRELGIQYPLPVYLPVWREHPRDWVSYPFGPTNLI